METPKVASAAASATYLAFCSCDSGRSAMTIAAAAGRKTRMLSSIPASLQRIGRKNGNDGDDDAQREDRAVALDLPVLEDAQTVADEAGDLAGAVHDAIDDVLVVQLQEPVPAPV